MTPTSSQKRSSISSAATLENLHINTCITEYTSIKRVNITLEFCFAKNAKGSPSKCLRPLLPLQVEMGVAKKIPQLQPKAKERKSRMEEC
jgi:hypothetical protein